MRLGLLLLLATVLFLRSAYADEAKGSSAETNMPKSIGDRPQLFIDDFLLSDKTNVKLRTHTCRKLSEPVMAPEMPWEQNGIDRRIYVYGTVLRDKAGGFRMWYNRLGYVLYAVSEDGVSWSRPEIGAHEIKGSKKNNVVLTQFHSPSVVYNPAADPERRYNMLGSGRAMGRGYHAAYSADGIHWRLYPRNPVLPGGDTCTLAHDPDSGEYLAFHKRTPEHRGERRRLVYLATSSDMQEWSAPKLVMAPDTADDEQVRAEGGRFAQFYNMSAFRYGNQFLGLVTHFRYTGPPPKKGPLQSGDDGPVDVQLVHSRDGRKWQRCEDRSPVIPNGPHDYDAGCILGVTNSPVIVGDELWLYYTAITTTHGGYCPEKKITIALAKWRLDGFASLDAGDAVGVVETVALACSGNQLIVNADASGGELTAAVLDAEGKPLNGYKHDDCIPLRSDSVRHAISWKRGHRLPEGKAFRLRFRMKRTRLFSFRVK